MRKWTDHHRKCWSRTLDWNLYELSIHNNSRLWQIYVCKVIRGLIHVYTYLTLLWCWDPNERKRCSLLFFYIDMVQFFLNFMRLSDTKRYTNPSHCHFNPQPLPFHFSRSTVMMLTSQQKVATFVRNKDLTVLGSLLHKMWWQCSHDHNS